MRTIENMSKWQRPPSKAPGRITGGVRVVCTGETVVDGVRLDRTYSTERTPSRVERAAAKAARRAANRAAWRITHRPQAKGKVHDERPHSGAYLAALDNLRDAKRAVANRRAEWNELVKAQRAVVRELEGHGRRQRRAQVVLDELVEERREAMREVNADWRRAKVRLESERQLDRQAEFASSDESRRWADERFAGRVVWVRDGDDETPGAASPGPGE